MDLLKTLDLFQAHASNLPRMNKLDAYIQGVLRMFRTSLGIQVRSIFNLPAVEGVEGAFFEEMTDYIMERMGWNLEIHGDLPTVSPEDRWIYLMNHPTLLATWPPLDFTSKHFAPNTAVIAKAEVIKNPFMAILMGNALRDLGKVGFINRDDHEEAILGIQKAVEGVLHPGTGLIFFPDAHRPYPSRLRKEREYWNRRLPDVRVEEWMTETCFPRSGGLHRLLEATEEMPEIRFANFTVADPSEGGYTFHIAFEELKRDEMLGVGFRREDLEGWLLEEWKRKNEQIREWRY